MNKLITAATIILTLGVFVTPAYAEQGNDRKDFRKEIRQEKKEFRHTVKEERKDMRQDIKDVKKEMKFNLKDLFKSKNASDGAKKKGKPGNFTGGTVSALNGSSFTLTKEGKTITVNTYSSTKFIRHFWGNSSLSEFSIGDKVNVWGKWTDDNRTTLDAKLIRNLSVMKRHGVFFGQISSTGSGSFILHTLNRGDQTVTIGSAKLVNRKEQTISASDLKVGDKVRVKGLWDKATSKITEVKQVKTFSLPKKDASVTPTVTGTVTPTVGPTGAPTLQ